MELRPGLTIDDDELDAFCRRRHHVRRLAVFGSALREDFGAESDIDVLVDFEPGEVPGLLRLSMMELELGELLGGREVEQRTYEDLSPYFRDRVREEARRIYAS